MAKICYQARKFTADTLGIITKANAIIDEYHAQGYDLTLRQLYYQFVARGLIKNKLSEYNRLGSIINDARLAGLIDWDAIVDRTRNLRSLAHWSDPAEIVSACAAQFRVDLWDTQPHRVEVWIEKDALIGVIENVCNEFDVPHFSCRGYTSQSEMWAASQRFVRRKKYGQQRTIVLHFGDHDPSGLDMTRDISDRIQMFCAHHGAHGAFEMRRLALNMNQVQQYNPPPNPAKATDARFAGYQQEHGDESWELDALEPTVIGALIRTEIESLIDDDAWQRRSDEQRDARTELTQVSQKWDDVTTAIADGTI
jgi:hypothetical protein